MRFLVLLIFVLFEGSNGDDIVLFNSPRLKYLDKRYRVPKWGPWEYCPRLTYARGFNVQVETTASRDDTSINSICLFCARAGENFDKDKYICSSRGKWGSFLKRALECKSLLVGFQTAQDYGFNDEFPKYGISSIKFICSEEADKEVSSRSGYRFTERQRCLNGQAICGIRTQVDSVEGVNLMNSDEAGLINFEMKCCDLPSPAHVEDFCEPRDAWVVAKKCDNPKDKAMSCKYEQSVGATVLPLTTQKAFERRTYEAVTSATQPHKGRDKIYQADFAAAIVNAKGYVTGYDWTMETADTFSRMSGTNVEFSVPPHTRATVFQVVGYCPPYEIKSTRFVRVDTKADVEAKTPGALPGGYFCDSQSSVSSNIIPDPMFPPNTTSMKGKR